MYITINRSSTKEYYLLESGVEVDSDIVFDTKEELLKYISENVK